ncbi:TIGR01459 family HAD-type hydrolase [Roseibium algae]|uniref:TIGR01459 family HAD-type hydrolase n=1 Tax=Roseibium algae TaxID=3123038 RepID=A0ABU8TJA6_9HYPH
MRTISNLSDILSNVDALLLDQFGVLHDGHAAFPGAIECVEALHSRGLPLVALSNSGRRAKLNMDRLVRLGFPSAAFKAMVTSGELTRYDLVSRLSDGRLKSGSSILILARGNDTSLLDGLELQVAELGDDVQLVIISGAEPETHSRDDYNRLLSPLARAGVPAICANPDTSIYTGEGSAFGPGVVAEDYIAAGGTIDYFGKPSAAMFEAGLEALGQRDPSRCLMVGDSLHHDILGGRNAGCQSLLITSGVQAGLVEEGVVPDFAMDQLRF